jgi:NTE family protein
MPDATAPVHDIAGQPEAGNALSLSGGGYRAMLFHLGCVWRLNDAKLLGTMRRISSVSGGSITSAVLGMNWSALGFTPANLQAANDAFQNLLVGPIRKLASTTIDEGAIFGGLFLPGTVSEHVADHYDSLLFHGKTLQNLPDDTDGPRFVINATNVQSGVLMRFSKPYMRDYRVGQVLNPKLPLALAVAASSAFPPVLSPCEIDAAKHGLTFEPADKTEDLCFPPYTTDLVLTDGGVYDNLGLEPIWKRYKTIFVSDGGGHYKPEPDPHHDWARHSFRVLDLIDSQVRALRTRQIVQLLVDGERGGSYWGIRQALTTFGDAAVLPCPLERTKVLAEIPTRLKAMEPDLQERLINWGYAVCDASLRKFCDANLPKPAAFPYPAAGV